MMMMRRTQSMRISSWIRMTGAPGGPRKKYSFCRGTAGEMASFLPCVVEPAAQCRVSLCSPSSPGIHYVDQATLEFTDIHLPLLGLKELQESLYASQRENLVLEEKLENLPTVLYEDLEDIMIIPEESKVTQKVAEDSQDRIQEEGKDIQEEAEDTQKEARVTQQEPEDTWEKAEDTLTEVQPHEQLKRASGLRYSFDTPIPLPATTVFPEDSTGMLHQSARPSLSPSNKDHH
ncbi:Predicted gene 550 [Apodemus speciosus]|uniref:Predicted gene 550 n=1 Tax=Apodemus speciosus TaxID=105296 RepID=A0ABQ0FS64_APOSI